MRLRNRANNNEYIIITIIFNISNVRNSYLLPPDKKCKKKSKQIFVTDSIEAKIDESLRFL